MIFLGNLTPEQFEKRLGIKMGLADIAWLEAHRQEKVNDTPLESEKVHIYDIPFIVMCDTIGTAIKVRDMMAEYGKENFKETLQIGWER